MSRPAASQRYEVLESLGEGGMAVVQKVRDVETGAVVALKRLRPPKDDKRGQRARALFQREYHTLSQLAHPRVIQVFDYGVDEQGPYYTMESLDGGDLQNEAPVPWKTACALMRDVCSVLSLLHSRQLVHRDISPRNIRCTGSGLAKLLDFGAMAPMGVGREVVGTPAICAPEVVNQERLDGRADLYSLGCTLYYALAGVHAFPARDFAQLPLLWGQVPVRPSQLLDQDLPWELDSLVMSLISLDPAARPGSATEVIERLGAVAELPPDDTLPVSHAYLASPTLVGREGLLRRARTKVERTADERGGTLLVAGQPGLGRSRFLDAVLLEGKFGGLQVLRADTADSQAGEAGAIVSLARQLLRSQPELARAAAEPDLAVLGHLLPELVEGHEGRARVEVAEFQQRRPALQQALLRWFEQVSQAQPLLIGVDDIDRVDEFSAAFVALLAHNAPAHRVLVAVTADVAALDNPALVAMQVLAQASSRLSLTSLQVRDTESLLRSVFGDVHHLHHLALKLQQISGGNPRDVMDLAKHLVEREIIRYEAGAWSVPAEIDDADVPASIAEALSRKLAELDADAVQLARVMALAPELRLDAERMLWMTQHGDPVRLMRSLDQLLAQGVLRGSGSAFELSQSGWIAVLYANVNEDRKRPLYLRLANVFTRLDDPLRAAQCWMRAGQEPRGLDVLVEFARDTVKITGDDPDAYARMLQSLPADWGDTFHRAFELCRDGGRPARDLYSLYVRAAGFAAGGAGEPEAVAGLIAQLAQAVGLDLYDALSDTLDPAERVETALRQAAERYERLPESEQVLRPDKAVPALGRAYLEAVSCIVSRLDLALAESLPSIRPLSPLSPMLGVVDMLVRGAFCRVTGRSHHTRQIYAQVLERAALPDRAGLDKTHHQNMVNLVKVGLGLVEGSIGSPRALERADEVAHEALYRLNALSIRMLHHLWQGDAKEAEKCRQRAELVRIQNGARQFFARPNLIGELTAYAAMDDLVQLKQALPTVAAMATRVATWLPIHHYARGEYQRIRGARAEALHELHEASSMVEAGRHPLFCDVQGAYLRALLREERFTEARDHGLRCLGEAEAAQLDHSREFIRMPLALAYAHMGLFGVAQRLADEAAETFDAAQAGKLLRGVAEETCARVALLAGDQVGVDEHAEECGLLYKAHGNHALLAKYERLIEEALERGLRVEGRTRSDEGPYRDPVVQLSTVLSGFGVPDVRAKRALEVMRNEVGASGAALYAMEHGGPVLVAELGRLPESSLLDALVRERLAEEEREDPEVTETGFVLDDSRAGSGIARAPDGAMSDIGLHCLSIAHVARGRMHVTGLAVFALPVGHTFDPPHQLASHLSRYWLAAGDATSLSDSSHWGPAND